MSKVKVLDVFRKSTEPLKAGEVAELSGVDKKEVEKIMNQLKEENVIFSPKRCFWELKK